MESLRRYKIRLERSRKKGFSLFEILIVIAIIGILAAIAIPEFQDQSQKAKESAAKDNLRILRNVIELYAAQHNGTAPGYANGDSTKTPIQNVFVIQLLKATNAQGQGGAIGDCNLGPYLSQMPENPFNNKRIITVIDNGTDFPTEATGNSGWIYKPYTKTIRLDWSGVDSSGTKYYDY